MRGKYYIHTCSRYYSIFVKGTTVKYRIRQRDLKSEGNIIEPFYVEIISD